MSLVADIRALAPQLAQAAQGVVDEWQQNEEGYDEELGTGGACDRVADAMADVIAQALPDADVDAGGHDGDDHAYIVVRRGDEDAWVDIPPGVYETGGGFVWRKIPGARITAADVCVGGSR